MAGGGRKKLRNRPTYGTTLLGGQKDPSASSSCTVSTPDFPISEKITSDDSEVYASSTPYVPPAPYVPPQQHPP
ncbi:hypothetical protein YC2023_121942 [Brassica napus]